MGSGDQVLEWKLRGLYEFRRANMLLAGCFALLSVDDALDNSGNEVDFNAVLT